MIIYRLVPTLLTIAGASLLVAARVQSPTDVVEVVILSGPNAGTYKTPSDETICMHHRALNFHAATWRDATIHDPTKMSSAAIQVANSDKVGPKRGRVQIEFGERGKSQFAYVIPDTPVTMTIVGKGAVFGFEGTIQGVKLKVTGTCSVIEDI